MLRDIHGLTPIWNKNRFRPAGRILQKVAMRKSHEQLACRTWTPGSAEAATVGSRGFPSW
jgi:hypothetical protein